MDFLTDVKYSIPQKVADLIGEAFAKLDQDNAGKLSMDQMLNSYNAKSHPHVLSRLKAPEDAKGFFMNGMERKADADQQVSKEGFIDYYAELNFCIPNERENYFIQLLKGTWSLINSETYVSHERLREMELVLFEKIREKSNGKTNEWKSAKKALHYFDLED